MWNKDPAIQKGFSPKLRIRDMNVRYFYMKTYKKRKQNEKRIRSFRKES